MKKDEMNGYDDNDIALSSFIFENLYLDEKTADIHFSIQNDDKVDTVPAHKLILTTGSKVFYKMFYGWLPEADEVKIVDSTVDAFKEFLQFFYMSTVTLTIRNIADVMNLIKKYEIDRCMKHCIDFLKCNMTNEEVCFVYQLAIKFELPTLKKICERKISGNAEEVLKSEGFLNCEWSFFNSILQLDSLLCDESAVLHACIAWAERVCSEKNLDVCDMHHLRDQLKSSLHLIHFQRMTLDEITRYTYNYEGLFTVSELTEIMQLTSSKEFKSKIFTTNPISYDVFTWDEDQVVECLFADDADTDYLQRNINSSECIELSSNKPLLLGKFRFSRAYKIPNSEFKRAKLTIEMEISEISTCRFLSKEVYTRNYTMNEEFDQYAEFENPILINPKCSYQFTFKCVPNSFSIREIRKEEMKFDEDITIKISDGYTCGLIASFYFNRL